MAKGSESKNVPRLRFAPSPTGSLHVGGARTALFNYLYARAHGGVFILRIEDTDRARSTDKATEEVLASLNWLGLDWDEGPGKKIGEAEYGDYGPYTQSKRLPIYQEQFNKLLVTKKAYRCFCGEAELAEKREMAASMGKPYVYDGKCCHLSVEEGALRAEAGEACTIRFKSETRELIFKDAVKGRIRFTTDLIGDFVICKSSGIPTYNFAVVVDDSLMKITHVLRGDDHISNTPRQVLLYEALGFPVPEFAHVPMILGSRREKLSKRDGATSLLEFLAKGYYPDPFINHLALLGWTPLDGIEIIAREKLLHAFKRLKFSSAPAIFDYQKLDYLNGHYIRGLKDEDVLRDFKNYLRSHDEGAEYVNYVRFDEVVLAFRGHCKKLADISTELKNFFQPRETLADEERSWMEKEGTTNLLALTQKVFSMSSADFVAVEEFRSLLGQAKEELGMKGKSFFMPLRIGLMGTSKGIELDLYFRLLERKRILARLERIVALGWGK